MVQRDKVMAIETVTSEIDFFVSSMGIFNINTLDHIKVLKNISLVENTGTFTTRSTRLRLPQSLERREDGDSKPVRLTTRLSRCCVYQALTQLDVLRWWNERGARLLHFPEIFGNASEWPFVKVQVKVF